MSSGTEAYEDGYDQGHADAHADGAAEDRVCRERHRAEAAEAERDRLAAQVERVRALAFQFQREGATYRGDRVLRAIAPDEPTRRTA